MPDCQRLFGTSVEARSGDELFAPFRVASQEAIHTRCTRMAYLGTLLTVLSRVLMPPRPGKMGRKPTQGMISYCGNTEQSTWNARPDTAWLASIDYSERSRPRAEQMED